MIKARIVDFDDFYGFFHLLDLQNVAVADIKGAAAVYFEARWGSVGGRVDFHSDFDVILVLCNDRGANETHRGERRYHHTVRLGHQNGAACGHIVRGGACRSCYDDAVTKHILDVHTVDVNLSADRLF